jgi:hypothetical protein
VNKKYGKFKLWQLIAIGAAVGLAFYLYKRKEAGGINPEETVGGTGTGAFGPIDPNSGIPYAFEGGLGGGGSGTSTGETFQDFLTKLGQIRELFPEPETPAPSTVTETVVDESRTKGAQKNARTARAEAKKARQAAHRERKARLKAEHQTTQKPKTTGAAAHVPHAHVSNGHPAQAHPSHNKSSGGGSQKHWTPGRWQGSGKQRHWVPGHW